MITYAKVRKKDHQNILFLNCLDDIFKHFFEREFDNKKNNKTSTTPQNIHNNGIDCSYHIMVTAKNAIK